jgi:hypothetical protein
MRNGRGDERGIWWMRDSDSCHVTSHSTPHSSQTQARCAQKPPSWVLSCWANGKWMGQKRQMADAFTLKPNRTHYSFHRTQLEHRHCIKIYYHIHLIIQLLIFSLYSLIFLILNQPTHISSENGNNLHNLGISRECASI